MRRFPGGKPLLRAILQQEAPNGASRPDSERRQMARANGAADRRPSEGHPRRGARRSRSIGLKRNPARKEDPSPPPKKDRFFLSNGHRGPSPHRAGFQDHAQIARHPAKLFHDLVGNGEQRWRDGEDRSARAVLRLSTVSNFTGACTRKVGRLVPAQDAVDILSRLPPCVDPVGSVGYETAGGDEKAARIHSRQVISLSECDNEIVRFCVVVRALAAPPSLHLGPERTTQ